MGYKPRLAIFGIRSRRHVGQTKFALVNWRTIRRTQATTQTLGFAFNETFVWAHVNFNSSKSLNFCVRNAQIDSRTFQNCCYTNELTLRKCCRFFGTVGNYDGTLINFFSYS